MRFRSGRFGRQEVGQTGDTEKNQCQRVVSGELENTAHKTTKRVSANRETVNFVGPDYC